MTCRRAHWIGENAPKWKGGSYVDGDGYRQLSLGGRDRKIPEHRLVAEKALGRPLRKDEVVHHIDGDKLNNVPENLKVCTAKEHAALHFSLSVLWQNQMREINPMTMVSGC